MTRKVTEREYEDYFEILCSNSCILAENYICSNIELVFVCILSCSMFQAKLSVYSRSGWVTNFGSRSMPAGFLHMSVCSTAVNDTENDVCDSLECFFPLWAFFLYPRVSVDFTEEPITPYFV